LAGDAVDDAAGWTEALIPTLFASSGTHQALATWLAALPEPVVRGRPLLCLGQAWLAIHRAEVVPAAAWVEAAERALPAAGDPRSARGAVAATRAFLATLGPDPAPERAGAWASRALADLAADDAAFRSVAGVSLGQAAFAQGQTGRAEQAFAQAAAAGQAAGLVHGAMVAVGYHVEVQRLRGARRRALATARAGLAWAGEHTEADTPVVGMLSTLLADLLRDGNELAAARHLAVEGLRAQRRYGNAPPLVLLAGLSLARLCLAEGDMASAKTVLAEFRPMVGQGPFAALAPLLDACDAEVALAVGDGAAAVSWATAVEPMGLPKLFRFETHFFAAGVQALAVTAPRVLAVHGRATGDTALLRQAEHQVDAAWQVAQRQELGWLRLRVLILRALIADARGDREAAMSALAAAVAQAAPERVVRPFVDEGTPMVALLAQLRETALERRSPVQGTSPAHLDMLLAAFPGGEPAPTAPNPDTSGPLHEALLEPLTARELRVLRLLAAGHSNADIARDLFIEQSTVKTHLVRLYRKLDVHSRTQAVAQARALRLLG
jgi:LuxR family transcriptional regulator, maltose regulon positive regulatory protein